MEVSETRRLQGLQAGNERLKKLRAEAMLDMEALTVRLMLKTFDCFVFLQRG